MSRFVNSKIVDIAALKTELNSRVEGMTFYSLEEARQFVGEIVEDLVERPAYDDSDINAVTDGGDIYDIINNVDALRDLENDIIDAALSTTLKSG